MAVHIPAGDLSRARTQEPNLDYPDRVEIRLVYGNKHRAVHLSADRFFGRGAYGAPIPAEAIVQMIENERRKGKPE